MPSKDLPSGDVRLPGVTHLITADPVAYERFWEKTVGFLRQHLGRPK